ncbi:hypothetical protein [Clostridium sp. Marseille-P299]|uniref:hypothetical protein n=1 Tax=Clostridium sp. Marseille-P299 TaxID=1805477 RepID=UPI000829DD02|nr:hypothetical protein [Clostridium sp. Marseille-P299]
MKNKNKILCMIGIVIIVILIVFHVCKKDVWDINADKLINSFNVISGDADIEDLSEFIPFEWDALYSFAPYTPKEVIYEVIGYKWDNISESVNENMNQIVFVKDGKVVCYLYGYPEYIKLGFDFGDYEGSYIKLTPNQNLCFTTTLSDNGVRYFKYTK